MTTIVFYNGVMASDAQESVTDGRHHYAVNEYTQKIYNIHGKVYGFSGDVLSINEFIKQLENKDENIKDYSQKLSVLMWDGKAVYTWKYRFKWRYLFHPFKSCFSYERVAVGAKNDFFAIGSGARHAHESFKEGNSLEVCIRHAATNDPATNRNVWLVTLEKIEKKFKEWQWMSYQWDATNPDPVYVHDTYDSSDKYIHYIETFSKTTGTRTKIKIINTDGTNTYTWE